MRRIGLAVVLVSLVLAPLAAAAQVKANVVRVGFIVSAMSPFTQTFEARLVELGYREGQNLEMLWSFHGGVSSRVAAVAADLVARNPDVIVAAAPPSAHTVRKLTTTIPIVFLGVGRPVETGLVSNLTRPGANVTGLSLDVTAEIHAKQLQLLRDLVQGEPGTRVVMLWNPDMRGIDEYVLETEKAARVTGIRLQSSPVRNTLDLETAVADAARHGTRGLVVLPDVMMFVQRQRLAALAATHRVPAIYPWRDFVEDGGLMSYGPDLKELARRAADYVVKILKGAKPGDLPVEQPTKFELVINLKTAKALGLTIPQSVLVRADEIIE